MLRHTLKKIMRNVPWATSPGGRGPSLVSRFFFGNFTSWSRSRGIFKFHFLISISRHFHFTFHSRNEWKEKSHCSRKEWKHFRFHSFSRETIVLVALHFVMKIFVFYRNLISGWGTFSTQLFTLILQPIIHTFQEEISGLKACCDLSVATLGFLLQQVFAKLSFCGALTRAQSASMYIGFN